MRQMQMQEENEIYIPFDELTTDEEVKKYLMNEVCDLANNYVRDKLWFLRGTEKYEIITLKSVKAVIADDSDLNIVLNI
jgi:hypothetical protein